MRLYTVNQSKIVRRSARYLISFSLSTASLLGLNLTQVRALTFKFNTDSDISPQALSGFETAGNLWSSVLQDDVTVNINISFKPLAEDVLGETENKSLDFSYSDVKTALSSDRTSASDSLAVNNLPQDNYLTFITNQSSDNSLNLDPNGGNITANNTTLRINTANAKALGLIATNTVDAELTFNSNFDFDFNRSNGIDSNRFDFIGIAAHEIGHVLGFDSGVDLVDKSSYPFGPDAPQNLDNTAVFSLLDLYRYSDDSVAQGNILRKPVLDLAAAPEEQYFSIDGGRTNLGIFSTGFYNGDGSQASHWKDDSLLGALKPLGIMDPTVPSGERLEFSELDLVAFDSIGWNRVSEPIPEPGTVVGSICSILAVIRFQKSRRKR